MLAYFLIVFSAPSPSFPVLDSSAQITWPRRQSSTRLTGRCSFLTCFLAFNWCWKSIWDFTVRSASTDGKWLSSNHSNSINSVFAVRCLYRSCQFYGQYPQSGIQIYPPPVKTSSPSHTKDPSKLFRTPWWFYSCKLWFSPESKINFPSWLSQLLTTTTSISTVPSLCLNSSHIPTKKLCLFLIWGKKYFSYLGDEFLLVWS